MLGCEYGTVMHPDGMAMVQENPQSFSPVHGFEMLGKR
jgi:hypothetical protein